MSPDDPGDERLGQAHGIGWAAQEYRPAALAAVALRLQRAGPDDAALVGQDHELGAVADGELHE